MDRFIRDIELPAVFVLTGNFYENMVHRGHMQYDSDRDILMFKQAIIQANAKREYSSGGGLELYIDGRQLQCCMLRRIFQQS